MMSLPLHVRTTVSQSVITKVTRLFNGSAEDVLTELLQNARRADASTINIETLDVEGTPTLLIRDDGRGIDDPLSIVTLGESGWNSDLVHREDPAGMGFFSLAGCRVEVRTYSRTHDSGWRIVIHPNDWESRSPIAVEPFEIQCGTEILIETPPAWSGTIDAAVAHAAEYYPLPVLFNSRPQERRDWLADAVHVEAWQGSRIGIVRGRLSSARERGARINFHGAIVACPLPEVHEVDHGKSWSAFVDIADSPELQLVLPARKEVVQNAALAELHQACMAAIFHAIGQQAEHRLAFDSWSEARSLGSDLPEAAPYLFGWVPPSDDTGYAGITGEMLRDKPMIVMPDFTSDIGQSVARALTRGGSLDANVAAEEERFAGYGWYDAIPKVDQTEFTVRRGDQSWHYSDLAMSDEEAVENGHADDITLSITFADNTMPAITIPVDVLVVNANWGGGVDGATVFLTRDTTISITELTDLLQRASFSDSDDIDADSYETQQVEFERDARRLATTLLVGKEQALLNRIEELLENEAGWLVPEGRDVVITLTRTRARAAFIDTLRIEPTAS